MLRIMGWAWAAIAGARVALYERGLLRRHQLDRPVVSVGALSVGGAGKTPTVALLASLLADAGYRPAILSRGYRRRGRGPLLVSLGDGRGPLVEVSAAGDEPYWLARVLPQVAVAVGERREEAADLIRESADIDVVLLDDGFQHVRVARDADVVVVHPDSPFWEDSPIPAGRLREAPPAAARADAFVTVGSDDATPETLRLRFPGQPTFELTRQSPRAWAWGDDCPAVRADAGSDAGAEAAPSDEGVDLAALCDEPAFAFAGIAVPERFFGDLRGAGITIAGSRAFADHHAYTDADVRSLVDAARSRGATRLLTTEKDSVRLPSSPAMPTFVWGYRLSARAPADLLAWLEGQAGLSRDRETR